MHTHSHAKLFTVLTIDPHTTPSDMVGVDALDDMHSPFIDTKAPQGPQQDLLFHTTEGFLRVYEGKVGKLVCGNVLLLLLADNDDDVNGNPS